MCLSKSQESNHPIRMACFGLVPKRRVWKAEQTFQSSFSKHFSTFSGPNYGLSPLKSASKRNSERFVRLPNSSFGMDKVYFLIFNLNPVTWFTWTHQTTKKCATLWSPLSPQILEIVTSDCYNCPRNRITHTKRVIRGCRDLALIYKALMTLLSVFRFELTTDRTCMCKRSRSSLSACSSHES